MSWPPPIPIARVRVHPATDTKGKRMSITIFERGKRVHQYWLHDNTDALNESLALRRLQDEDLEVTGKFEYREDTFFTLQPS